MVDKTSLVDRYLTEPFNGVKITLEDGTYPALIYSDGETQATIMSVRKSDTDYAVYLQRYQFDGTFLDTLDISDTINTEFSPEESVSFTNAVTDVQGNQYFLYNSTQKSGLLIFDPDGNLMQNILCEENAFYDLARAGEHIYLSCSFHNASKKECIYQIDTHSFALTKLLEVPNGCRSTALSAVSDDAIWFSDHEHLWKYQISANTLYSVFEWTQAGLNGQDIHDFAVDDAGNVAVVLKNQTTPSKQQILYLQPPSSEQAQVSDDKIIITLNGSASDNLLNKTIGQFNASNDTYKVELVSYDSSKLLVELISGKGPDIIDMQGELDPAFLAERGIIEDLNPYLDDSKSLQRSDILDVLLNLYTVEDVLTAVPPTFSVMAPMGRASELGTEPGWTFDAFLNYVESHRGAAIYGGTSLGRSSEYLIGHYINTYWDSLVDYTQKKASFQTSEFKQIMEYAKGYEDIYGVLAGNSEDTKARIEEGKLLLYDQAIRKPTSLNEYKQFFDDDMVVIGYPSTNGEVRYCLNADYIYGINTKSEHKEGAWEFIEFLLTVQTEEVKNAKSDWNFRFSSYLPALDYQFQTALEAAAFYRGEAVSEEVFAQKKKDIEDTRDIISKISCSYGQSGPVVDIVNEEFFAYLENGPEYTAEMAINNIQNRVQLYLDSLD